MTDNKSGKSGNKVNNRSQAPRARNRTVVLTPDIAGKVRAQLSDSDSDREAGFHDITEISSSFNEAESQPTYNPSDNPNVQSNTNGASSTNPVTHQQVGSVNAPPKIQAPPSPAGPPKNISQDNQVEGSVNQGYQPPQVQQPLQRTPSQPTNHVDHGFEGSGNPQVEDAEQATTPNSSLHGPVTNSNSNLDENRVLNKTMLCGFLVSFDDDPMGNSYELREGRTIVSSELPSSGGRVVLVNDPSVSSMHAVLKIVKGSIVLLDQLSESGTFVKRSEENDEVRLSGEMAELHSGDLVRFGNKVFSICLL